MSALGRRHTITTIAGVAMCSSCGANTREEFLQRCPHGTSGENEAIGASPGAHNHNSNSSSSSNDNNSSINGSSVKNSTGEVDVTDQDGNSYKAVMKQKDIAESLDLNVLRLSLREVSTARLAALGIGNKRFGLDSISYIEEMSQAVARIKQLDQQEQEKIWKSEEGLSTLDSVDNSGNVVIPRHTDPSMSQPIRSYESGKSDNRLGSLECLEYLKGREIALLDNKGMCRTKHCLKHLYYNILTLMYRASASG